MRGFWIYDWEVYYNFACVTFIHTNTEQVYIDAYVEVDIKYLHAKKELEALEVDFLVSDREFELNELIKKYKSVKQKLLEKMIYKSFFIYNSRTDKSRNLCQLGEILMFFNNHKVLMGYNSINYDSHINDYILICGKQYDPITGFNANNIHITQSLKEVSDEIINIIKGDFFNYEFKWKYRKYKRWFEDYDIQKILYLDKTFVGLKSVAINLRWHRIQELPLPHDSIIEDNQLYDIYDYNVNDVLITHKLTMNQSEEITLREQISERYNINVLNESRSSIGKKLMSVYYSEKSGLDYRDFKDLRTYRGRIKLNNIIDNKIKFITPELKDFLKQILKESVSVEDTFSKILHFRGTTYTLAKGGIHSIDDSRIYNDSKYIYRDADVTSYYPTIIELFRIAPQHIIRDIFLELISFFKNDRVKAKHEGRKLEAEALKIVINRIYGALSDTMDYLYDPKATYETTLNGQLSLLMLIEKLEVFGEGNIKCISANTDGIVCKFLPEYEELYNKLCKEWETETGFNLEYTDYELYARSNVNNYVAIKKGFTSKKSELDIKDLESKYIKGKGDYITETPFNKGFIHPIVSIALYRHLVFGEDYVEIIKTHWKKDRFNILDYCISQKVDKKFDVVYTYVKNGNINKDYLQQYNRFYVCTSGGGSISKCDVYNDVSRSQNLISKYSVKLFNDFYEESEYNINYRFYIRKVEDFLYFKKKNSKGNHKYEGLYVRGNTLFD